MLPATLKRRLKYLSVCSGIEAATVAWHPLGFEPVAFAEVDRFPAAVLAHHYPHVPNRGDMNQFQEWPNATVDVLVGGTPCQSFSVAGLRAGLADPRGNLMLVYLALADRYRPEWVVWENVPGVLSSGGGRDFGAFLGGLAELGYGFAYRVLDAQYFGLAQRRKRVFVVGHLGDWRRAAAVLFERESLSGHPAPRREAGQRVAPTISGCSNGGGANGPGRDVDSCESLIAFATAPTIPSRRSAGGGLIALGGNNCSGPIDIATAVNAHGGACGRMDFESAVAFHENQRAETTISDTAGSLKVGGGKPGQGYPALLHEMQVRRLTPLECCRLQGFPDTYLDILYRGKPAADGPKYKALGNSMAVPVMRWIGEGIAAVSA